MTLKDMWELARTPMAAPETKQLRRLRYSWMTLCVLLAISVSQLSLIEQLVGKMGALVPLSLVVMVPLLGWRYFRLKRIADDRWLYEERP